MYKNKNLSLTSYSKLEHTSAEIWGKKDSKTMRILSARCKTVWFSPRNKYTHINRHISILQLQIWIVQGHHLGTIAEFYWYLGNRQWKEITLHNITIFPEVKISKELEKVNLSLNIIVSSFSAPFNSSAGRVEDYSTFPQ